MRQLPKLASGTTPRKKKAGRGHGWPGVDEERHDAAQKKAGRGHGWPGVDEERHDAAQKNSPPGPWMARRA